MLQEINSHHPCNLFIQLDEGARSKSSLFNRFKFSVNWEVVMHVCNTAMIIAGIAYGFFMNFPTISLGLLVYGAVYVALALKGNNKNSSSERYYKLQQQLQDAEDRGRDLSGKVRANLRDSGLQEQAERDQRKIDRIAERKSRLESERKRLKVERDQLKDEIRILQRG